MSYPSPGQTGALQTKNGHYVCADQSYNWELVANRNTVGQWETFQVEAGNQGRIGFRSLGSNHYVCADVGQSQDGPLHARDRNQRGDWEEFTVEPNQDGSFSLRANANRRIVCADQNKGQHGPLFANRDQHGEWESFRWIPQGGAPQGGGYPGQQQQWGQPQQQWNQPPQQQQWGGQPQQNWNQPPQQQQWGQPPQQQQQWGQPQNQWGQPTGVPSSNFGGNIGGPGVPQNGQIGGLQCTGTGKYWCTEQSKNWEVICNRDHIGGDWEKFRAVHLPNGRIAFQATSTQNYVCTDVTRDNRGPLQAHDRKQAGDWESFTIEPVGDGSFALRSHANNKIVCADQQLHPDAPLFANRDQRGAWETFRWHPA